MSGHGRPPGRPPESPGPPGASPGVTPKDPGGRWLTAPDVGVLIGRSERVAREWLDRYDIPYRDTRPRRWSEAAILARLAVLGERPRDIPEASRRPPGIAPESPGSAQDEPIEATFRTSDDPATALVPLVPMLEQLRGLGDQLTALAERSEALALEAGQLRERTAHQAVTIAELRQRVEAAERERDELRVGLDTAQAAPPTPEAPTVLIVETDSHTHPRPLWRRLLHVLQGRRGRA